MTISIRANVQAVWLQYLETQFWKRLVGIIEMASSTSRKRVERPAKDDETVGDSSEKKRKLCGPLPRFEGINFKRCRPLNDIETSSEAGAGDVLYWMSRDQRVQGMHSV